MTNFNKVIIGGRMTKDAELKQTQNEIYVTQFTIAVDSRFGDNKDTNFINIVAWRKTAEFISKYFYKGNRILIVGSIQSRKYKDKEGKDRTVVEVVADEVFFVDKKSESVSKNTPSASPYNPYIEKEDDTPKFEEINKDDDLPF